MCICIARQYETWKYKNDHVNFQIPCKELRLKGHFRVYHERNDGGDTGRIGGEVSEQEKREE